MLLILFSPVENREYCSNRMFFPLYLHLSSLHSAEIRKKNVTFNWTCGDMFQLRKICDAWKVAHLSKMTQKARLFYAFVLCHYSRQQQMPVKKCRVFSECCGDTAPLGEEGVGESRACPCPLPTPLPTDAPHRARLGCTVCSSLCLTAARAEDQGRKLIQL